MKNIDWKKVVSRLVVAVSLAMASYLSFRPLQAPRLSMSGYLGFVNLGIIGYLLLLSLKQVVFLFLSAREEIRRESLPLVTEFPPISIIVPAYNEGVVIKDTIQELLRQDYPELEIIVVDDGSGDDTYELATLAAEGHPNVRVFTKPNSGKAGTLNFGISQARHPFVFCMDADSYLRKDALRMGMRHMNNAKVGAVAGAVLIANQKNMVTRFQTLEYLTGLNFYKSAQSFIGMVTIVPGPSGLFRKTVIERLGGYQSDTFAEDCDLTLRILMAGYSIVYEPEMEVRTEAPEKLLTLVRQRYRWNRGILQATSKHLDRLLRIGRDPLPGLVIFYFLSESLLLPLLNLGTAVLSLVYELYAGDFSLFSLWLSQLTLLDISVVIVCLCDGRWPLRLILYASINRFSYSFFQDIVKILSMLEEMVGVEMNWGKLERVGRRV